MPAESNEAELALPKRWVRGCQALLIWDKLARTRFIYLGSYGHGLTHGHRHSLLEVAVDSLNLTPLLSQCVHLLCLDWIWTFLPTLNEPSYSTSPFLPFVTLLPLPQRMTLPVMVPGPALLADSFQSSLALIYTRQENVMSLFTLHSEMIKSCVCVAGYLEVFSDSGTRIEVKRVTEQKQWVWLNFNVK